MQITGVKISLRNDDKLKAFATLTFDGCFVVRGMKIIRAARGLFVAMPARRKPDGTFQDVAHPVNPAMRAELEKRVLVAYQLALDGRDPGSPDPDDVGPGDPEDDA